MLNNIKDSINDGIKQINSYITGQQGVNGNVKQSGKQNKDDLMGYVGNSLYTILMIIILAYIVSSLISVFNIHINYSFN